jgi:hypothetical protein
MQSARNNIVRFNLSIDDRDHVLYLVGKFEEANLVHNNTFSMSQGDCHIIPRARLVNNIFCVGGSASLEERDGGGEFLNNCYYGNWKKLPSDTAAVNSDPQFLHFTSARDAVTAFKSFKLRSQSPCRARGVIILDHGARDLTGSNVPTSIPPDLGALQFTP